MRPLTETLPKPLIAVAGTPLLDRVVDNALAEGVNRFAVNAHYHADQIEAAIARLATTHPEAEFQLSDEHEELLDTGGGARKAARLLSADPYFVFNTDAFWPFGTDAPLKRMAEMAAARPEAIVLLCAEPGRSIGYYRQHDFFLGPNGVLSLDGGRPMVFAGVSLLPRHCLEAGPPGAFSVLERFHEAAAEERLLGVLLDAPWLHVGDPKALAAANRLLTGSAAG